jgi:hypothetical protein
MMPIEVRFGTSRATQSALLAGGKQDLIADILSDPQERELLLRRHDAYLGFANGLRTAKTRIGVPWWSTNAFQLVELYTEAKKVRLPFSERDAVAAERFVMLKHNLHG